MTELLSAAQMRAIEMTAIKSGDVTGLELMERAGAGVVEAVFEKWPEFGQGAHRAVVLCGPGNNGGDGFVIARLLMARGWQLEVFLYGDPSMLPPDAKVNYERWVTSGETRRLTMPVPTEDEVAALESAGSVTWPDPGPALIFDALFGTGLTRPIDALGTALREVQIDDPSDGGQTPYVVAVDIASGLCADSGRVIGNMAVGADLTVSFHRMKLGHVLAEGPERCGGVAVVSIGLDDKLMRNREALAIEAGLDRKDRQKLGRVVVSGIDQDIALGLGLAKTAQGRAAHKYSHGHALVLSGGFGKTGAARLTARGALRIGAGLVTLGAPGAAQMEVASQITALMLRRVEDGDALAEVLRDDRVNALCLGPGMGIERAKGLVPVALRAEHTPRTVLDADALTAFADDPETLFGLLHEYCVLTPHGGEFARLFPDIASKLYEMPSKGPAFSKVDAAREAAARAGCVVLFKGPDTVIADPKGRCSINVAAYEREAPWLATAGSGDVLAGFITGLLARGLMPMHAAETAAWLHVECARSFGPGLIAEDLPEKLPAVFRTLEL